VRYPTTVSQADSRCLVRRAYSMAAAAMTDEQTGSMGVGEVEGKGGDEQLAPTTPLAPRRYSSVAGTVTRHSDSRRLTREPLYCRVPGPACVQ